MSDAKVTYVVQYRSCDGSWLDHLDEAGHLQESESSAVAYQISTELNALDEYFEYRTVRRTVTDEGWIEPPSEPSPLPGADPKPHREVFDAWWEKKTVTDLPPSPVGSFNAVIAEFNALCGVSIAPVAAGERMDTSIARVMTGLMYGVTKVLQEEKLGGARAKGQGTVYH